MKKFISMVMAAAMVVTMVPATAFAATDLTATAKIVDDLELTETEADKVEEDLKDKNGNVVEKTFKEAGFTAPELQLKITNADYRTEAGNDETVEVEIELHNAVFADDVDFVEPKEGSVAEDAVKVAIVKDSANEKTTTATLDTTKTKINKDKDEVTLVFKGLFGEDDKIVIDLDAMLTKTKAGTEATIDVKSDDLELDAKGLVFASVLGSGIEVAIDDLTDVAPEEIVTLDEALEIEVTAGKTFASVLDEDADELTLKLNSGFEFANEEGMPTTQDMEKVVKDGGIVIKLNDGTEIAAYIKDVDENELVIGFGQKVLGTDAIELTGIKVEATTAKEGDVATITVKADGVDSVKAEVAKVVESGLVISVDEDEDVPVMWSGVSAANDGLTADEDEHEALEVTIEETFVGAYNDKDEIELVLPEGVYVTDVDFGEIEGNDEEPAVLKAFKDAYKEGDHKSFVFEKRAFTETQEGDAEDMMIEFTMTLVADSTFVGDVTLEMLVDGESKGEVVIAKFEAPMIVEAAQNDLKIDYRNTAVGTDIVIKEAEAGLWEEGLKLYLGIDDHGVMEFEDDATFTVNEDDSDMEISDKTVKGFESDEDKDDDNYLMVEIDKESKDEAGVITISDIELFMERNIPAGAYDLTLNYAVPEQGGVAYPYQMLFAPDCDQATCNGTADGDTCKKDYDCIIDDVSDWTDVVKEGWINVVTAGREQDDASFTTKVVVPVGESYIIAGENTIALDVPAYVSAAGYTMLPVRAVATALGINNNNVMWDQATKTVTILYGQRIITMQVGAKVINVNGSAIPASASVEVVNGRTFLPMRDLATALGVTDITWDAATKTATLNGNI